MTKLETIGIAAGVASLLGIGALTLGGPPDNPPITLRDLYGIEAPTELVAPRTALVLVDFQEEFFRGRLRVRHAASAAHRARELLAWARDADLEIVHVRNVASRPDSPVFAPGSPTTAIVEELAPRAGELVITKASGGGFTRTTLDTELRARGISTLVVAGIMTHLAVDMTARDASTLGYRVIVASDATATRDLSGPDGLVDAATVWRASLAALADRFAAVRSTRQILALPCARGAVTR